ncbi:MAG TPA: alanine-zipper protein [Myxococcota bacterium]|nr:alanine-zipper protein [Myxococcota bacterium]
MRGARFRSVARSLKELSMSKGLGVRTIATAALIGALAATGCATSGDIDAARAEAADAKRIAEEANAKADRAAADAAAARAAADAAAEEAKKASEKSDRIFQRTLHK